MTAPFFEGSFAHTWQAEVLASRPIILPARHFIYPREAEEIERGALEVLVRPANDAHPSQNAEPFLATCALGFRDPMVPAGLWSTPRPEELCAVSGGYAYIIDTTAPEHFTMIPYRPVLDIRPLVNEDLLLFIGHISILAWGSNGRAWESERLSSEGITITGIDSGVLHGLGWDMKTDKETPFTIDLRTGLRIP
jgi:hypothetical protein